MSTSKTLTIFLKYLLSHSHYLMVFVLFFVAIDVFELFSFGIPFANSELTKQQITHVQVNVSIEFSNICSLGIDLPSRYANSLAFLNQTLINTNRSWFGGGGHTLNAVRFGSPIVNLSHITGPIATDHDFDLYLIANSYEDWDEIREYVIHTINKADNLMYCGRVDTYKIPRLKCWKLGLPKKVKKPIYKKHKRFKSYAEIIPFYIYNDTHLAKASYDGELELHPRNHILPFRKVKYGQFELNISNTIHGKYDFVDSYAGKYGYGCYQIVFSRILWEEHLISVDDINQKLKNMSVNDKQLFMRNIEKAMYECAKNLNMAGYASFYQCWNEDLDI